MADGRCGVSVVTGELSALLTAMRRGSRWNSSPARNDDDQDPLIRGLYCLQEVLNSTSDLSSLDVGAFIGPFCAVVQSDETTGPITGMAIASLDRFLAFGLIDVVHPSAAAAVESLSEAVTHARFVGTNPATDEVVLMKILQVLHTLVLSPVGCLLSNESVCEIMQSCFRICFEMRLSELLRCVAESTLVDMVQLLFSKMAAFSEDALSSDDTSPLDQTLTTPTHESHEQELTSDESPQSVATETTTTDQPDEEAPEGGGGGQSHDPSEAPTNESAEQSFVSGEICNVGSRHKPSSSAPYGLPCVRELLRFLVSITTTHDKHNSDSLIAIGLNLVTVAIECSSTHLCQFHSMTALVQDQLCKNLIKLLRHDSFLLFGRSLRCLYLLFESCRAQLKLQLEVFVNRLLELMSLDLSRVSYDRKELALECIVQLCHLPHFIAELYVNFDCGLYTSNVYENLTKVLSKNAFPTQGALFHTHLLSLDALLAIVHSLEHSSSSSQEKTGAEQRSHARTLSGSSTQLNSAGLIFTSSQAPPTPEAGAESVMSSSLNAPILFHSHKSDTDLARQRPITAQSDDVSGNLTTSEVPLVSVATPPDNKAPPSKQLLEIRQRKKLILAATEQFNKKPSRGVSFLSEQGVFRSPLEPLEVASWLHDNPGLNKAMIGEYVGDRRNSEVLHAFVRKCALQGVPMVDALRAFLESFRLPGESPIVERILEVFSQHWLDSNSEELGRLFANYDAVHVLSYAVMMLNTDLHSSQVRKKMTLKEFIHNQRKTNNGGNFPEEFLASVYSKIREEEIIMPAEHKGAVRENYQWKLLLLRSSSSRGGCGEGVFQSVSTADCDQDLFLVAWGPTVAALSYVFDTAEEKGVVHKAIAGFSKCAAVAAHFELREVFDNLLISLCKFTTLLSPQESAPSLSLSLGGNPKIRLSTQTVFSLAHRYGNSLREGWRDLLECLLTLFKTKLLPEEMVEVEDFLAAGGRVSLFREEAPVRSDSSLLSSFYSYLLPGNDQSGKSLSPSEIKARKSAMKCIKDCHPEQLFSESTFLRDSSLLELVKALTFASRGPAHHQTLGSVCEEDAAVFFLELLVSVAMANKDRLLLFWSELSSHLARIIVSAQHTHRQLLERAVVCLLRLAVRLVSREELTSQLLSSLGVLLTLPPPATDHTPKDGTDHTPRDVFLQMASGLAQLALAHTASIKERRDWTIFFTLLEFAGTGLSLLSTPVATETSSHDEIEEDPAVGATANESCDGEVKSDSSILDVVALVPEWTRVLESEETRSLQNSFDVLTEGGSPSHEPQAFFKCCESLAHIVRSEHSISAQNYSVCVRTIRIFTEVAASPVAIGYDTANTKAPPTRTGASKRGRGQSPSRPTTDEAPGDKTVSYTTSSLRLLDLLDTLYSRVGTVFDQQSLAELQRELDQSDCSRGSRDSYCLEVDGEPLPGRPEPASEGCGLMWELAWCPLLQGMARMCCDSRRSVRQTAITYLQRALLAHDLQHLSAAEWGACFTQVFFPMLSRLLEDIATFDLVSLEETRVRASNLLCKVFLQHLPVLSQQSSFAQLWLRILECMRSFLQLHNSDLLYEAIPESLKNMLLVMATQGVFDLAAINTGQSDRSSGSHAQELWELTWNRIEEFLPHFLKALFPNVTPPVAKTTASHDLPPGSHDPSNIDEASESTSPDSPTQESTNQIRGSPPLSSSPETGTDMFPITLHPPLPSLTPSPLTPSQHGGTPGNVSPSGHMTSSGSHDHSAGEGDTDHMTESVRSHDGEIARQHISVVMETNGETLLSARDRTVVGMEPSIALGSVPEPRTAPVLIQQPTFSGNHGDAANRIAIPVTTTVFNL